MHFHHRSAALAALWTALAVPAAAEVDLGFVAELSPLVGQTGANAGTAVALEGDYALLGAPGDSVRGSDAGAVHVWQRVGGVWTFDATIRPAGVESGDRFGASLALEDGVLLVGAPGDDTAGQDAGLVYVYERGSSLWSLQQSFTGSQVQAGDGFGSAVAIHDGTAVVGAPLDDQHGNNAGAAYVMKRGVALWGEQERITAPGAAANDQFGSSAAVHGDLAVVGAPAVNGNGVNSGAAYTFARTGNVWAAGEMLPDVGASWFDGFGASVATDGVRIAVGAPGDDSIATDAGGAWTFVHDGVAWTLEGAFAPTLDGEERLGSSVALVGDTLLVGAPGDDYVDSEDGSLLAAEWGGLAWVGADVTGNPAGQDSDSFGSALATDGDLVLVGANLADLGVADGGNARLFSVTSDPVATPVCLGDGSGPDCPCDNFGGLGEGCANSSGAGAKLVASGQAIVGDDSFQLVVLGARTNATGVFLQGNNVLGTSFRDGLLCVTGETFRLEIISLDDAGAGSSSVEISTAGVIAGGDTRIYQFWYRDAATGPCGLGSNLSGALQVEWQ